MGTVEDTRPHVGMGQVATIAAEGEAWAVVGSCVALAIYHPRLRVAGLGHVVLPSSRGQKDSPGKFADTAVTHLVGLLSQAGAPLSGLAAKLAGGANMFRSSGPLQVGQANLEAVRQELSRLRIPIVNEHVGGCKGRKLILSSSGNLTIEIAGEPAVKI